MSPTPLEKGSRRDGSKRASTSMKTKKRKSPAKGDSSNTVKKRSKRVSSSKALVPVSSQQTGLSSRERLAKKRAANSRTKTKSTQSKRVRSTRVMPSQKKRRAASPKRDPVMLTEQPWFIPTMRALYEGTIIVAFAATIFLLVSLLSYSPTDSGFSQVGLTDEVQNLGGRGGAWIADLNFSLMGYLAYWIPVVLGYGAYSLFTLTRRPWSWMLLMLRGMGHMGVIGSGALIVTLHLSSGDMPMAAGGILGEELSIRLSVWLSPIGMTILATATMLLSLSMIFDLSWSNGVGWLGRQGIFLAHSIVATFQSWKQDREAEPWVDDVDVGKKRRRKTDERVIKAHLDSEETDHNNVRPFEGGMSALWHWLKQGRRVEPVENESLDIEDSEPHRSVGALQDQLQKLRATKERFLASREARQKLSGKRFGPFERGGEGSAALHDREEPVLTDALFATTGDCSVAEAVSFEPIDVPAEPNLTQPTLPDQSQRKKTITVKDSVDESHLTAQPEGPVVEASSPEKRVKRSKSKKKSLFGGEVVGELPPVELLDPADKKSNKGFSDEALDNMSRLLELKLRDFNIEAEVEAVIPGPVVTRFEIQPAPGIKVMRITNLAKDLARSLAVISVRVVEVIPGKTTVGIEIPNAYRETIRLRDIVCSDAYEKSKSSLTLCLGKDISGHPVTADLGKMPHLLVAGTTGSGKSVGLNAMLISMLFKATPDQLRMIMIDPKMLELSVYDDIPHLLSPVVTDMKEAANALRWCVAEMERRYRLMAAMGVRNLAGFNRKVDEAKKAETPLKDPLWNPLSPEAEAPELGTLPNIVVVIDEFADMMMIVGKKVEELIARIAQKARAAGIHLILATQRPSVDVITGLIKANVPSRIAFQVSSKVDSRTILDQGGAEQLLGAGDMLYLPPGTALPQRVHGAFVTDEEVHRVCDDWRERGDPDYLDEVLEGTHEAGAAPGFETEKSSDDPEADPLYDEAVKFVTQTRKASISAVQRKLKIGYNRAARMIDSMEAAGVVTPMQNNGSREVIAPPPV